MPLEAVTERWRRYVAAMAQARGQQGGPVTFLDDVMPVLPIVDSEQAELHLLRGEQLWGLTFGLGAAAAQFSGIIVRNRAGSGRLVVVEVADVGLSTAVQTVGCRILADGAVGTTPAVIFDTRMPGAGFGSTAINVGLPSDPVMDVNTTGAGIGAAQAATVALTQDFRPLLQPGGPIILVPGSAFEVRGTVANTAFTVNLRGYVRAAEPSELTLT